MSTSPIRVIIICEGQTEKEFCTDVLVPHFLQKSIYLHTPLIKKSGGGIVPWKTLKSQIEAHLKQESTVVVTTLIDFYGIHKRYEYPKWEEAKQVSDKVAKMELLENGMKNDIEEGLRNRFIPYIQLHEFEGLLFSNLEIFIHNFEKAEFNKFKDFIKIFEQFQNPEDINDGATTAPSKRLCNHIQGYNKVVYGATLAEEIGLKTIREKCPRFNEWIRIIENI